MAHTEQEQLISLYIDSALSDKDSSALFAHLTGCSECRMHMKIATSIHSQIAGEALADVPLSLDRRVRASVARESAAPKRQSWYSPIWFTRISIPLPAAASIVFLLIVGSLLFSPLLTNEPQQRTEIPSELMSKVPASLQRAF